MAGIEAEIRLKDGVSSVLRSIEKSVGRLSATLDSINAKFDKLIDPSTFNTSKTAINGVNSALDGMGNRAAQAHNKINQSAAKSANSTQQIVNAINQGNRAILKFLTSIYRANINQLRLNSSIKKTVAESRSIIKITRQIAPAIDRNCKAQEKFNGYVRSGVGESYRFLSSIKNAVGAYLGFQSAQGIIQTADSLVTTKARLDLINDGFRTTEELQQMIYESAMNSRSGYLETADMVAKLATRAGNVFGGNDEAVLFANTLQKMFHIAGASTQEMNSASLQLVQALGSGVLRGEELNAVFEAAPNVIQAIADYMDKPVGKIRKIAKDGEITASVVKNAMFKAADDVNKKFASMPWTWAQVWTIFKNFSIKAFEPLLDKISSITASDRFKGFLGGVASVVSNLAKVLTWIFDTISKIASYLYDNWSVLKPVIMSVVVALILFRTSLFATKAVMAVYNLMLGVAKARTMLLAKETFLYTTQQTSLNMALMACPWVWVVGGVITLIGVIGAAIAFTYDWENSNIDLKKTIFNVMTAIRNITAKTVNFLKNTWLAAWDKIKEAAAKVRDIFKEIGQYVVDNWSFIEPIVWGIVGAFAAYKTAMVAVAVWNVISGAAILAWKGIVAGCKLAMSLFTAATWKQVWANIAATVSGWAATSPYLFWIVVITAIIVAFYLLIAGINELCGTSISATGLIIAAFALLYARIYNGITNIWNHIASFAEFFVNVWSEPIYSVKKLFVNLATNVIDCLLSMTRGCDKFATSFANAIIWAVNKAIEAWNSFVDFLPDTIASKLGLGKGKMIKERVSFTSDLESAKATLEALVADKPADYWEAPRMEYMDYGETMKDAYEFGASLGDKLKSGASYLYGKGKNKLNGILEDISGFNLEDLLAKKDPNKKTDDPAGDLAKAVENGFKNPALDDLTKNIAKNTGDTADNTKSLKDEDAEFLRQIAEKEAINRYTLTDLKVEMNNSNSISSNMDIDDVMKQLGHALYKAVKNNVEAALP